MKLRRVLAISAAAALSLSSAIGASAATLKDVFDADYYASKYSDLREFYGDDAEALWNHFITCGLQEGRSMNGLIDVVKYREKYGDLNEVFGDDWDAYLNHYLTMGAKEGRDSGTGFYAMDYAARYEDVKEAYGEDVLALWNHYQTAGAQEHREIRSEAAVAAEKKAREEARIAAEKAAQEADKDQETQKPDGDQETQKPDGDQETQEPDGAYTKRVDLPNGGWRIEEYNEDGKMAKSTSYSPDGTISGETDNKFDDAGNIIEKKQSVYMGGTLFSWIISKYNTEGKVVEDIYGFPYKEVDTRVLYEYDDAGRMVKQTEYDSNGNKVREREVEHLEDGGRIVRNYDKDGNMINEIKYDADGKIVEE